MALIQGLEILEFYKVFLKSLEFYCGQLNLPVLSAHLSWQVPAKKP